MSEERPERAPVEVAVGILIRKDGAILMGSRPEGKPYAGWWEFPGGKLEPGESGRSPEAGALGRAGPQDRAFLAVDIRAARLSSRESQASFQALLELGGRASGDGAPVVRLLSPRLASLREASPDG